MGGCDSIGESIYFVIYKVSPNLPLRTPQSQPLGSETRYDSLEGSSVCIPSIVRFSFCREMDGCEQVERTRENNISKIINMLKCFATANQ